MAIGYFRKGHKSHAGKDLISIVFVKWDQSRVAIYVTSTSYAIEVPLITKI